MLEDNKCVTITVMVFLSQPWLDASGNNIISNNKEAKTPLVLKQFVSDCR